VRDDHKAAGSHVPTETGQTAYKRELAFRRLGINPNDVQYVPFLATQLRRIGRVICGAGMKDPTVATVRPLEYLASSEDPGARKVLKAYRSVPESYRRLLRPEDFCHAAGVSPWRVLEIVTLVSVRQAAQASAIRAAIAHPRVVAKTIERALEDDGARERMALHRAVGFLPTVG
jgi:hypothetical protein